MKDIIDQFVEIRKEKGISQKELATLAGLKPSAVARIEHKRMIPTINMLNRLLTAIDLELSIVDSFASPHEINKLIKNLPRRRIYVGRSGDKTFAFGDKYILKISDDVPSLRKEKEKNEWISKHIKSPKIIEYKEENGRGYLLREYLQGHTLIEKQFIDNPNRLISILVKVISIIRGLDDIDCPFVSENNKGNYFVHGDLCLPNIVVDDNDEFIGFIDVGNSGKGDIEYDYCWLLWSLENNLKTNEFNLAFQKQIGYEVDPNKFLQYVVVEMANGKAH